MSDLITLTNLVTAVRRRADQESSEFVTDPEVTTYINDSYQELWDLITTSNNDYAVTQSSHTIASGSNTFNLPADHYKLRGLDFVLGQRRIRVPKFMFEERNRYRAWSYDAAPFVSQSGEEVGGLAYRLIGNTVYIEPRERAAGEYLLWYIPVQPKLVNGSDTIDSVNGWHEYVIVDAAIKCLRKEESSTTSLEADKDALQKRILKSVNRTPSHPERVTRTRFYGSSVYPWRG